MRSLKCQVRDNRHSQNETNLYHKIRWLYQDTIDENGGASGGSCYRSGNHKRFWPTETN
jgi:hypothetical protein